MNLDNLITHTEEIAGIVIVLAIVIWFHIQWNKTFYRYKAPPEYHLLRRLMKKETRSQALQQLVGILLLLIALFVGMTVLSAIFRVVRS